MMLHSIASPSMIFPNEDSPAWVTKNVRGGILLGREKEGRFTAERLLSTDPAMYLNQKYRPGSTH